MRNTGVFSNFSQRDYCNLTNTNVFTVQHMNTYIHTYVHTDTTCVQHVNVGLVQARPNYVSHTLPTKNRHCKISSFALRCSATELLLGRECRDTYNTKTIMSVWNRFCLHHCSISNVFHCSIVYLLFCWHMASLSL